MKNKKPIFGRKPVLEIIQSGEQIEKVVLQANVRGEFEKDLRKICKQRSIPIKILPKERMDRMIHGNHQGIAAYISDVAFYRLEDLIPMIYDRGEQPLIIILDSVTDVRNFGAIARSAEIFGAHALVIPTKNTAQINADAIKTSAGAIMNLPVCREPSLTKAVELLQLSGIQVFASDLKAKKTINALELDVPTAIIIGAEDLGVSRNMLQKADQTFIIPQKGQTDSLNVSVATGVILYEIDRQRRLEK